MGEVSSKGAVGSSAREARGRRPNDNLPFFFLASCPEESVQDAVDLAVRYGGFHCAVGHKPDAEGDAAPFLSVMPNGLKDLNAWRGRVEAQYSTLQQMSSEGRQVIAVAIAGLGVCNDQREFLLKLCGRKAYEQLEVKQCGDIHDMERWLRSIGYISDEEWCFEDGSVCVMPSMRQMLSFSFHGKNGPNADPKGPYFPASKIESPRTRLDTRPISKPNFVDPSLKRALAAVDQAVEEATNLPESCDHASLRNAAFALGDALALAREAGASKELAKASILHIDLETRARFAEEESRASRGICCCCCWPKTQPELIDRADDERDDEGALLSSDGDPGITDYTPRKRVSKKAINSERLQARIKKLEHEVQQQGAILEEEKLSLRLPTGTKCMYLSSTWTGWVPAFIVGFDSETKTYNLNIKRQAPLNHTSPSPDATLKEAWPIGSLVTYLSDTAGCGLPAVVVGYNPSTHRNGSGGTYDLDIKQRAQCNRLRPRVF